MILSKNLETSLNLYSFIISDDNFLDLANQIKIQFVS